MRECEKASDFGLCQAFDHQVHHDDGGPVLIALRQIVVIHIHNSLMLAALFLISSSRLACLCLCGLVAYPDKVGRRLVLGCTLSGVTVGILLTSLPNLIGILIGLAVLCSSLFATQTVATAFVGHNANAARQRCLVLYAVVLHWRLSWSTALWACLARPRLGVCSLSALSQSVSALPLY